ncbi:hypothetical protein NVP1213O_31 [Vibrio phage 1.213.O._10N.222.54.F10]|nr:hypothetical protein NVP1213O_31 [Vibrio phage 1.213.O._10N.222.54.F10]
MGWNQDVARIIRFIPEFEKKEAAISAALIETRKLVSDLNKITEGHGVIDINGKKYLDKSEVEKMISDFASKQDVKKLEVSTSKLIDEKLKPVATKKEVNQLSGKLHSEIKNSTSGLAVKSEFKKLESSVYNAIDDKLVPLATKNEVDKLSGSLQCAIKSSTSNLATKVELKKSKDSIVGAIGEKLKKTATTHDLSELASATDEKISNSTESLATKSELKVAITGLSKSIAESSDGLTKKIDDVKSIEHLSMSDVNEALKPYELTKDVNGKIKSCRDTMGENYDLYTKSLSKKFDAVNSGVDEFKKSQTLAYDKLEKETSKSIIETGQKLEKSILKKVLDKISKLMG